jgi:hypothetical protein
MDDKRKDLVDLLKSVVEPNGDPYFSKDWIVENIIGIKDKAKERKKKIKRILKDE